MDQANQTPQPSGQPTPPTAGEILPQLEKFFNTYLHEKIPFHLPKEAKEWIVKYGPWIAVVLMLLALPVVLAALSFGAFFGAFASVYGGYHVGLLLEAVCSLAAFVLEAAALPGLFKRSLHGWQMVYYASLVTALGELLALNIVGLIVGLVISMYFLFEIKEYYK